MVGGGRFVWREERVVGTRAPDLRRRGRDLARERRDRFGRGPRSLSRAHLVSVKADPRLPGRLYAGVDPGALFVTTIAATAARGAGAHRSPDAREMVARRRRLDGPFDGVRFRRGRHGSRRGLGGRRLRSDDGGASWTPRNAGVRADFLPEKEPPVGQCVHHMEMHRSGPTCSISRITAASIAATTGGDTSDDISAACRRASLSVHARCRATATHLRHHRRKRSGCGPPPMARLAFSAAARLRRVVAALTKRVAQTPPNANVMRMAMTVDAYESAGCLRRHAGWTDPRSRDAGDRWSVLFNWLPPIYSLETAVS